MTSFFNVSSLLIHHPSKAHNPSHSPSSSLLFFVFLIQSHTFKVFLATKFIVSVGIHVSFSAVPIDELEVVLSWDRRGT